MSESGAFPPWQSPDQSEAKRRVLALAHEYLVPGRVETFAQLGISLVIGRREAYRFWDLDGREFLDVHLNGGTYNLGHRHPALVLALSEAMQTLDIGNHHFPSAARAELAAKLAACTPGDLHYTVFASGGGEAVDVAIKSARRFTGRRKVVAMASGYHGHTGLAGCAGDDANARYFASDRPDEFVKVPFNDLDAMHAALRGRDVAAVMLETIPATYGFPVPADDYLPGVASTLPRIRRALHRGRSADRARAHRLAVGRRGVGRAARHPRHGQGPVGRPVPDRSDGAAPRRGRMAQGQRLGPRVDLRWRGARLRRGCARARSVQ